MSNLTNDMFRLCDEIAALRDERATLRSNLAEGRENLREEVSQTRRDLQDARKDLARETRTELEDFTAKVRHTVGRLGRQMLRFDRAAFPQANHRQDAFPEVFKDRKVARMKRAPFFRERFRVHRSLV